MKKWLLVVLVGVVLLIPGYDLADQVERVRGSVVHVSKEGVCQGSGFMVAPDIVCTAKHVTDGTHGAYTVTDDAGKRYSILAVVEDKEHDLAYLKLSKANLPPVRIGVVPRVGDPIFIMGSPLGFENFNSVTLGIVSALQRDLSPFGPYGWQVLFQSTSPAFPGNSGGPVFDMDGRVVGVLVAGAGETLNYCVPASFIDLDTVQLMFALGRYHEIRAGVQRGVVELHTGYED